MGSATKESTLRRHVRARQSDERLDIVGIGSEREVEKLRARPT